MPTTTVSKKISAYPITAQLKSANATMSIQILKVTEQGFLAEAPTVTAFLQPGEKFDCSFELPVLHHSLNEPVRIIKLYSQLGGPTVAAVPTKAAPKPLSTKPEATKADEQPEGAPLTGMVEAHFLTLSEAGRRHIGSFLKALAKTKK